MNKNKICVKKSYLAVSFILVLIFLLFYLYQTINNTIISTNSQAAVKKRVEKPPKCTVIALSFGSDDILYKLGVDPYQRTPIIPPLSFINKNGIKVPVGTRSPGVLTIGINSGDIVSLLPENKASLNPPCEGDYLGNVFSQKFNSTIQTTFGGRQASGYGMNITSTMVLNDITELCRLMKSDRDKYYPAQEPLENINCDFTTVIRTASLGGLTTCKVHKTGNIAFNSFINEFNPNKVKSYAIALLRKNIEKASSLCNKEIKK